MALKLSGKGIVSTADATYAAPGSQVRAYNGNGHGSTNTNIRRFSNNTVVGSDISYADSATLGATFTINADGIYSMSYTDVGTGGATRLGISLNSASLGTQIQSLTATEIVAIEISPAANQEGNCSATIRLSSGNIIRPHTNSGPNATDGRCHFWITQIVKF